MGHPGGDRAVLYAAVHAADGGTAATSAAAAAQHAVMRQTAAPSVISEKKTKRNPRKTPSFKPPQTPSIFKA